MKKQEKFTTRPIKLKVHTANLQAISSYPVRFSADILFFSLVFFAYCLLVIFGFLFLKLNIYILMHISLCGWVSNKKKFSTGLYPEERLLFFFGPRKTCTNINSPYSSAKLFKLTNTKRVTLLFNTNSNFRFWQDLQIISDSKGQCQHRYNNGSS